MSSDRDQVLDSLFDERTVDIVTTGRRTGRTRVTEIWTTCLFGQVFICGTPNAGRDGVERTPRDWLANLLAEPRLVLRLKNRAEADLPAVAEPVTDPEERRRILSQPSTEYYRNAVSLDVAVAHSPIVRLTFVDDAAWLNEAVASR
jgi:hypothetical protein